MRKSIRRKASKKEKKAATDPCGFAIAVAFYALPSHGAVGEYDGAAERDGVPYGVAAVPYGVLYGVPYGAEDCADVAIDVGTDVGQ